MNRSRRSRTSQPVVGVLLVLAVVATGDNGPRNGATFFDGAFIVAGGTIEGGALLRVGLDGSIRPLIANLPSRGDHHTNSPVIGPDGWAGWRLR